MYYFVLFSYFEAILVLFFSEINGNTRLCNLLSFFYDL